MQNPHLRSLISSTAQGAATGTIFALWTAAWLVTFVELWERGRLSMGVPIPEKFRHLVAIDADRLLGLLWDALTVDLPTDSFAFTMSALGLGALGGAVTAVLAWIIRADRQSLASASLRWAVHGAFDWRFAIVAFGLIALAVVSVFSDSILLLLPTGVILVLVPFVMPIIVCRPDLAAQPAPVWWWSARWPGFRRVLWVVGIQIVAIFLVVGPAFMPSIVQSETLLVEAAVLAVFVLAPLLQARVLLSEGDSILRVLGSTLNWRFVGPWLSYHVWLLALAFALLVPVLVVYIWLWKVVPIVSVIAEGQGLTLPTAWAVLISSANFLGRFYWLFLCFPISFVYWLGTARLTYLVSSNSDRERSVSEERSSHKVGAQRLS